MLDIMQRLRGRTTVFYSTHILDDVQRISDTVAVLHEGVRVAQAATEVLLAGDGTPSYLVEVRGGAGSAIRRLESEPWVDTVAADRTDEGVRLRVTLSAFRDPLTGFGTPLRREVASWSSTGRWWRRTLVWTAILAGLFALMHWVLPAALPAEAGLPDTTVEQTTRR